MTPRPASPAPALVTSLLEGLVLGLARSLRDQELSSEGFRNYNLRDLLRQLSGEHAAFASLLRQLFRLGPSEYIRRELVRLKGEL